MRKSNNGDMILTSLWILLLGFCLGFVFALGRIEAQNASSRIDKLLQ